MTNINRTFRIFVSSTFEDMINERNKLHEQVFPKLRELCLLHGARFQAIDLRWGVRKEAALDHKALEICIEEIKRCQNVNPRPNFLILLGNRYGWRPLPYKIPEESFISILKNTNKINNHQKYEHDILKKWYRLDKNSVPSVYILQPREEIYETDEEWALVERKLRNILLNAIKKINLKEEERIKYESSATEQEIFNGALKIEDNYDHVFGFFRNIETPLDPKMGGFVDLDEKGNINQKTQELLTKLKDKLRKKIPNNIKEYPVVWDKKGIGNYDINLFCDNVYDVLSEIILKEIAKFKEIDSLAREVEEHKRFAKERRENFTGRKEILTRIEDYVLNENDHPLVVYGDSGSGKSALMAQIAKIISEINSSANIIIRFFGITPNSSNCRDLLENVVHQIYRVYGKEESNVPFIYKELNFEFKNILSIAREHQPLIIILDALDQISSFDEGQNLTWLPFTLPNYVRIIVSTTHGKHLDLLKMRLPDINFIELKYMSQVEGQELLNLWLKGANRTLQTHQNKEIISKFYNCGLPLYLKLAFEKSRHWKSYTEPEKTKISTSIPSIIIDLFKWLSLDTNHGQVFVSNSLSYLAVAKNGLTEDEIIDILSDDPDVLKDFDIQSRHKLITYNGKIKLPIVLWSRFYHDIEPYLTNRRADGTYTLNFFHSQFQKAIIKYYLTKKVRKRNHLILARYFGKQKINPRKISELPYNLMHSLPSRFNDNEKEEESLIVQQAAECLINVSKDNKGDLAKHIEEIEPIGKWLFNINKHENVIGLVDDTLEEIENQCYWTHIEKFLAIGIKSAESLNLIDKKALYLYSFARTLLHRGQYKKSEKLCKKALELVLIKKNKKLEANILWHLGTTERYMGNLDDLFLYIEKAEKIARSINDTNILIKSLITKGIAEHGLGNFKKALKLYDDSFELYKSAEQGVDENRNLKNSDLIPSNKSEIIGMLKIRGSIGYQTNNFSLAKESWEMWLKMAENAHAERDIKNANAKLSLINPDINSGELKQIFKEILEEFILAGEKASAITSYGELAEICIRRKEYYEAIKLCNDAINYSQNINNLHVRSAKTYVRGIQALAEGKLKKALKHLKKSEKLFAIWASPYRFWVANTFNRLNFNQ